MQSDNIYLCNEIGISLVKDEIQKCFGEKMCFRSENVALYHHGWFELQYLYVPKNYIITFESEFNGFYIRITAEDGGHISLNYLDDFKNDMVEGNIVNAIAILKKVIDEPMEFFKVINDKLYRQTNGIYKRVKNRREKFK